MVSGPTSTVTIPTTTSANGTTNQTFAAVSQPNTSGTFSPSVPVVTNEQAQAALNATASTGTPPSAASTAASASSVPVIAQPSSVNVAPPMDSPPAPPVTPQ